MNSSDLRFYLRIFARRLPLIIIVWLLGTAVAVSIAYLLPPVFRAKATILVQSQQIPGNLAQTTVPISAVEQIQILRQRLLTRENMLEIADQFHIYDDRPNLTRSAIVDDMRLNTSFANLRLANFGTGGRNSPGGATAFEISFAAHSPSLSSQVTNEFVTRVLERNVALRTERATETLDFFEQETERLAKELARTEAKILEFKRENAGALPSTLTFRQSQVSALQNRLMQLESSEASLRQTVYLAEQALANPLRAASQAPKTKNQQLLEKLKTQRAQQLAVYSSTHPSIISLESQIKALEKVVSQEILDAAKNPQASALPGNQSLVNLKTQLDLILNQKEFVNAQIIDLKKSIDDTPRVEVELNNLNREYANLQNQYNANRSSSAQAATGERIELRQKGQRFEVVEQATPPEAPESPNRIAIAVGGSFGGFGLGIAIVMLLEFLNSSVRRPAELISKLNIQPLATIPYIVTRRERSRKRFAFVTVLFLVGVTVPASLYAVHYYYLPIDLLLQNAINKIGLEDLVARMGGQG
ncbi:MAG: GumC family protein [Paracoccaceae bacterium]